MFRLRAQTLAVREERDGLTVGYSPETRPWLIICTDVALSRMPFGKKTLRAWGYRFYDRDPSSMQQYYARPLLLWALLRAAVFTRQAFWRAFEWLYARGVFHLAAPEGTRFRWRDVRLGPERK